MPEIMMTWKSSLDVEEMLIEFWMRNLLETSILFFTFRIEKRVAKNGALFLKSGFHFHKRGY
jgi:hypothetical protein